MNKKVLIIGGILVFVVLMVILVLSKGGTGTKPKPAQAELVWWKTFEDPSNLDQIATDFGAANKGITVRIVKKDPANYEKELVDALASGKGPDIFTIHNDWVLRHSDKISPMPDALMTVRQYNDTFLDVASSDFIKDSKIYAVPLSVDVLALYYNRDMLNSVGISQPPKTWDEVASAVQRLAKVDRTTGDFNPAGIAMGTSANVNRAVDILSLLMLQKGAVMYDTVNNTPAFNRELTKNDEKYNPGVEALKYYTQFANPSNRVYSWNAKANNSIDAFSQNKLAMMLSYSYMRERIQAKAPTLNWGVAAAPQEEDSEMKKVNFANYWGESVSKASKNPDLAWEFLKYATEKAQLAKLYEKHKLPASRKDMIQDQYSDLDIGVFAENAPFAKSAYKQDPATFENVFLELIDAVVLKNTDPKAAISQAAQKLMIGK
ncbi:MAG: extracellular solute-binding protein [Acidobacteriaceae bacterium]